MDHEVGTGIPTFYIVLSKNEPSVGSKELGCKHFILYCLKIDHGGRDWDRNFLYCIVLKWTMR